MCEHILRKHLLIKTKVDSESISKRAAGLSLQTGVYCNLLSPSFFQPFTSAKELLILDSLFSDDRNKDSTRVPASLLQVCTDVQHVVGMCHVTIFSAISEASNVLYL